MTTERARPAGARRMAGGQQAATRDPRPAANGQRTMDDERRTTNDGRRIAADGDGPTADGGNGMDAVNGREPEARHGPDEREEPVGHAEQAREPEQRAAAAEPAAADGAPSPAATGAEDLAAIRALALRAYPDAVPELVGGGSVADLIGSLEPARAAFRRIAEAIGTGTTAAPAVPAGASPRLAVDPDALPPAEKIRRALADRQR